MKLEYQKSIPFGGSRGVLQRASHFCEGNLRAVEPSRKNNRGVNQPQKENGTMTKRAANLIGQTYGNRIQPAISALVEFAAQNSGLEFANYGGDGKAYREEARDINQDWQRFKTALAIASAEGVTDKEVIAAAPGAFSGRLEWISENYLREKHGMNTDYTPRWSYTTGQYFPTEYRKAAATVLEAAIRAVRQARPPQRETVKSIAELKALNEKNGGCWFEASTMRFFGTKIESGIIQGKYFVTSEQQNEGRPRKFTLRTFDTEGDIGTIGEFHAHDTKAEAIAAIYTQAQAVA